jgi:hypothetical protein
MYTNHNVICKVDKKISEKLIFPNVHGGAHVRFEFANLPCRRSAPLGQVNLTNSNRWWSSRLEKEHKDMAPRAGLEWRRGEEQWQR